jgi:hypothetical protein
MLYRVQMPGIMTFIHFLHKNGGSRYDFKSLDVRSATLEKTRSLLAVDDYKPLCIHQTTNSDYYVGAQIRF